MACVDVRALPLQLLLRRHREWEGHPVAVVDYDKPLGVILWVNEHAAARRIRPGMRYAAGLALARDLRGGVVTPAEIDEAVAFLSRRLWGFSPRVEPSPREPGVFRLDASGMGSLYPSLEAWAERLRDALRREGFRAVVAVGFSRFGCYAAARSSTRNIVFSDPDRERAFVRRVPVERLGLDPNTRDLLLQLGIDTLGAFMALPAGSVRRRFGPEAEELHAEARGDGWAALDPSDLREPAEHVEHFDYPEDNLDRLLARLGVLLSAVLADLSERHEQLESLRFTLTLDDGSELHEEVSPAAPTLDAGPLLQLLRLRLEALALTGGVVKARIRGIGVAAFERQLALFVAPSLQHLDAVHRAFARLRAEFGNDAVVRARLCEAHLPEARYRWEPLRRLPSPRAAVVSVRPLVRRLYTPPVALPPRERHEPDGWLIAGIADGPVEEVIGPQFVCGGWWVREVSRAYYYVRTRSGRWFWIYQDRKRRRWYLQGEVQ